MNNFALIRNLTRNADLRRLCLVLGQMQPGDEIDETEVATLIGCDKDTTSFLLDTLHEVGALALPPNGGGAAREAMMDMAA